MIIRYVSAPVTDLRKEPIAAALEIGKDPLQESQLLQGEAVVVERFCDGWAFVEVIGQQKYTEGREWRGYPGWVNSDHLSAVISSPLRYWKEEKGEWHQLLVSRAHDCLGIPYLWGGRSKQDTSVTTAKTGVDCSGMVHLLYQSIGVTLPRDAHDQFLVATKCSQKDLLPGDLIFSRQTAKSLRINHVMLYVGEGFIIEAAMTPNCVRKIELTNKQLENNVVEFFYGKIKLHSH